MTDRLSCCVPFCKRTRHNREGFTDWICSVHWPAVSKTLKKRRSKLDRRYRLLFGSNPFWAYKGGSPERIEAVKLARICGKAWDACKRQAIERAVGI